MLINVVPLPERCIGERLGDSAADEDDFDGSLLPEDNENVLRCLQELKIKESEQDEMRQNFGLLLVEEYIGDDENAVSYILDKLKNAGEEYHADHFFSSSPPFTLSLPPAPKGCTSCARRTSPWPRTTCTSSPRAPTWSSSTSPPSLAPTAWSCSLGESENGCVSLLHLYLRTVYRRCDENQNANAQLEQLMGHLSIDEEGTVHPP